jgi:two-component system, sensor histidine kinase YesM
MKTKYFKKKSLIVSISVIIAVILLMTLILCAATTVYSYKVVNKTVVSSQEQTMTLAASQINSELKSATYMLTEAMMDYITNQNNYMNQDSLSQYLASMHLATLLDTKMESNTAVDCVFFSNTSSETLLTRFQSRVKYKEKFAIADFVSNTEGFDNDATSGNWHVVNVNGVYYLQQFYRLRYGGLGVLVNLDNLLSATKAASVERDVQYVFTDLEGTVLAGFDSGGLLQTKTVSNGKKVSFNAEEKFLVVTLNLPDFSMRLSCIKATNGILYGTSWMPYLFILLGLVSIVIIAFSSVYLRRKILVPIGYLMDAIKIIESGNLDYIIAGTADSVEFETLITSFNYMTKEIKNQKIKTYEEAINRQRAELKYLQMQLRPHFYLNAINTISSLSQQGKNKEIQKFITALSDYLRYLFTDAATQATVQSEVEHAVAYIRLQQVKYPNLIFYMSKVEEAARSVPIPKLLIQTFAENIFKHAFDGEKMLSVFIRAQCISDGGADFVRIVIEDSGCGFSEKYLNGVVDEKSVGIRNIRQTLKLTYGRDDLLLLSNSEQGGARIILLIPKERRISQENESDDS